MPFDPNSVTPAFIGENLKKQKCKWRAMQNPDRNKYRDDIQMEPDHVPDPQQIESQRQLKVHKKENAKYWKKALQRVERIERIEREGREGREQIVTDSDISLEDYGASSDSIDSPDSDSLDTGNKDYYKDDYKDYWYAPKIRDLSQWYCYQHRASHAGHRLFCVCGMPMVAQLCGLYLLHLFILLFYKIGNRNQCAISFLTVFPMIIQNMPMVKYVVIPMNFSCFVTT